MITQKKKSANPQGTETTLSRMKFRKTWSLAMLFVIASAATGFSQFNYTIADSRVTVTGYTGPPGAVTIPEMMADLPVVSIGKSAFANQTDLTSVSIPDGVTSIGDFAFYGCSGLTNVTIGSSVTSIGLWAFVGCSALTSVTIPSSVTSIGEAVFSDCVNLCAINVASGNQAFCDVDGVLFDVNRQVLIAYPNAKSANYTIPSSVTSIGSYAFSCCYGLTSVTIPSSVTSIGYAAFEECSALTSVSIPDSVISIGDWAFWWCSQLTSVTIGCGITSIGTYAFSNCTSLKSAEFLGVAPVIGVNAFPDSISTFTIYYHGLNANFSSPLWNGYASVNLDPLPFAVWQGSRFTSDDVETGLTTMTADFDHDGMTNLLEFAFGGDPKAADSADISPEPNVDGTNRLQISFQCDTACADIFYTVQAASDMTSWTDIAKSSGGATTLPEGTKSTVTDTGTGQRTVTVTDSTTIPAGGKRFLRVKVSSP